MKKFLITLLFVLIASNSWATKVYWYNATSHTGGGANSLDSINGQNLIDGDKCLVVTASGRSFLYNLDDDSALTEDSTNLSVITPDSNAGDKRWILMWNGGRILVPDSTVDQGDSAVTGTLAWHISNASSNDTTVTVLPGTHTITTNTTVPATMTLKFQRGGILSLTGTLTVSGSIEAGPYRIFDGTLSNLTLAGQYEVNATWGGGIPDGSTDQTTDLDGLIAACVEGTEIVFPTFASSWKFNVSIQTAGITLRGQGAHKTSVIPNSNATPVFDLEANRIIIKGFHINGNGAGTTAYGIRADRGATSAAGGWIIEDVRIQNVTHGIYVDNNYYNLVSNAKIEDITYGVLCRNACNNNVFSRIKFDDADYGIAILNVDGTDTHNSHGVVIESCAFESLNSDGIGVQLWNVADVVVQDSYFEGTDWPVIEAGGPIKVVHNGGADKAYLTDSKGRDFVKMGVQTSDTVYNRTNGESGTISAIGDDAATNDKLTITLSGGEDFDDDDYCVIDLDNTVETALRNKFENNTFSVVGDLQSFFDGISHLSGIIGNWSSQENGGTYFSKVSRSSAGANLAANTELEIDISSNYGGFTGRPLMRMLCSVYINNDAGSAAVVYFKPPGSANATDGYIRIDIAASGQWSGQLEIPINSDFKVAYEATQQTDLGLVIHAILQ